MKTQKNHVHPSRSMSQHLLTEQDIKKIFPYTQSVHNRYLEQNRLEGIRDELNNQQQQSISIHVKDLITKDKVKPRLLQPLSMLDESINKGVKRMKKLLYHDSQNINLHNLNQRREMVQLAQWLDMMIEQVHTQNLTDYQEYYNKLEVVFQGSVLELERQISMVGFEFGQFLKKLWEAFTNEIQKIILGLYQRSEQIEQKGLEDLNKLHEHYQNAIEKQTESMQMMKEEVQNVQNSIVRMKKENIYLRKKDRRREEQMQNIMSDFSELGLQVIAYQGIEKYHQQAQTADEMDFILQQKDMFEFFKQKFEGHKKEMEDQYKILQMQDEFFDISTHLIITESSVDTSDLIKTREQTEDTSEYFIYVSTTTQTPKQARKVDEEIQVQPLQGTSEIQVNSTQLRRERIPRNLNEQKMFRRAKFPLNEVVQEYSSIYFPEQELSSNDPQFVVIIQDQIGTLKDRIEELLQILNLRGDNSSEDVQALKDYLLQNYSSFSYYFTQCWNVLQTQISSVIDAKIDKEEMELEMKEIENKFSENVILFKKYHSKQRDKETISKFFEDSLVKVIRYAPQFLINSIKEQANQYGVLENVEFKEFKRRQGTTIEAAARQSQTQLKDTSFKDLDSPTRSPNKLQTIVNIAKPLMKIQKIPSQAEISSKEDDEAYKSDSSKDDSGQESDVSFSQIKLDFKQSKPKLTIEKKLRIQTCPIKSAIYATNILKQMISKFHANSRTGLYQLSTILQSYQELIMKIPNTTQNTPLHVHMYENIVAHYGQSQFSDANRYKRTIRSFIYFESKSVTCQLVVKFLKAMYDIQDLNLYLQIIQTIQDYPNVSYSKFIDTVLKWFTDNQYSQSEIENIIYDISTSDIAYLQSQQGPCDYDIIMNTFLEIYQKYKNRTSIKYKHLFAAVDVLNKGSIDFQQWNFLYEVLCCINYSFSIRLFCQEADYTDDIGKMMSKQRFTLICDELKIFQDEEQMKLLDRETFFSIKEKIQKSWMKDKIMMKMSFIKANKYNKFIKSLFAAIDAFVQNAKNQQFEPEAICYMFKLISKTYKPYFLEAQLNYGMPIEFSLINSSFRSLEFKTLNKE